MGFCAFAFVRIIGKAHDISPEISVETEELDYNTIKTECQQSV